MVETIENIPEATLLNPYEPTHIAGKMLELTFISRTIAQDAEWQVHPHLASDHYATCTTLNIPQLEEPPHTPKWKVNKADWPSFQEALERKLENIPEKESLDEMEERLVTAFHHAANTAIPKTKPTNRHHKDRWYYNDEVKEYNNRINQARKLNRRHNTHTTRTMLRAAISIAREATKRIKYDK